MYFWLLTVELLGVSALQRVLLCVVQMVCSFLFWPLAAIMGVEIEDASLVAGLIGTKVFADELISFTDLNVLVCNRQIKVYYIHTAAIIHVFLHFTSMYVRNSQSDRLGRLKIRDVKLRHNQKCGVGKCETQKYRGRKCGKSC